jgi:hypothetical protein
MTIELKQDNFYRCIWRADLPNGDLIATLWKEASEGNRWTLVYRFRYYKDEKVFNSKDEKNWYTLKGKTDTDEEGRNLEGIFNHILEVGGKDFGVRNITRYDVNGDGLEAMKVFQNPERSHIFHARTLNKEQYDEYERTGKFPEEAT